MAEEEKKYSFISVDVGKPESSAQVEEQAGVRTSHTVVDGEDTIVVSTVAGASDRGESTNFTGSEPAVQPDPTNIDSSHDPRETSRSLAHDTADQDQDENVPFARMQAIIILALVALIIVFFIYFNFLR